MVLISGRRSHKNLFYSILAVSRFCKANPDWNFVVCGVEPSDLDETEGIENLNVLGYVPDDKYRELWSTASAVFIPSVYEGFGLVYVEAALSGKLLIACDLRILNEVVADYERVIRISSPFGEREVLAALDRITSFEMEGLHSFGFQRDQFCPKSVAKQYFDVIYRLKF